MAELSLNDILKASNRISQSIIKTDIIFDEKLNKIFSNEIYFKLENKQKTGSFKARGAFNHLLYLQENNKLPQKIVAVTSGNHGAAIAYICFKMNIECLIYTSIITPEFKIKLMKNFGATIVITKERFQANSLAQERTKEGYHFIHPSADNLVIAGQGTVYLECVEQIGQFDSIFASCGGGGLISGIYIASKISKNRPKIFAIEPEAANDAQISVKNNQIYSFLKSPTTIADGARTLAISDDTFKYLKKITNILTIDEKNIKYWTSELGNVLKIKIEETAAMAAAGCFKWIKDNNIKNEKIVVILSGGNKED